MAKEKEYLSAEIAVEDKASKQFEKITKSMQEQNNEFTRMNKEMEQITKASKKQQDEFERSKNQMDRMAKAAQKQRNELERLKNQMERTRQQGNKKTEVEVETTRAERNIERLKKSLASIHNVSASVGRGLLSGISSRIGPNSQFGGNLAAVGAGYLGKQVFDSTFLNAAKFEQSSYIIDAMFNDQKKSQRYIDMLQKQALASPLLNSQDMFANSKSFVSLTKDSKQLQEMWKLTERLLAVDDGTQGVFGAVLSLRELFSGDVQSLVERFELPRSELNAIKKLPLEQQLKALDKLFVKFGMTDKLVKKMGESTLGTWNQIKEVTSVALREIGKPAVDIIRPFLQQVNEALQQGRLNRFVAFGQDMAAGVAEGFVRVASGVGSWIDDIITNPEFEKLNTIEEKFQFVLDQVYDSFDGWYKETGSKQMTDIATGLTTVLVKGIENNLPAITEVAVKMGASIGKGIADGIASDPVASAVVGALIGGRVGGLPGAVIGGGGAGGTVLITNGVNKAIDYANEHKPQLNTPTANGMSQVMNAPPGTIPYPSGTISPVKKPLRYESEILNDAMTSAPNDAMISTHKDTIVDMVNKRLNQYKKKAIGVSRVPRDNFPILAHEGETLLTKQQSNQRKQENQAQVLVTGNTFVVREEADIDKIALALALKIEGVNM